ncbi:MAG: class II aldolase/adducin family protein [Oscillospiraceae bacterium]|nr:class II aldolase/adducin family protein [Oscillospiraceae bacterium]
MLNQLKEKVFIANQDLLDNSRHPFFWISVSSIHRESGNVVFIPDGGAISESDMAIVDLNGNLVEGKDLPVRDAAIHLALYRQFPEITSIAHPYCRWATIFAQLELDIPTLGTVHADTFHGSIPVTAALPAEVLADPANPKIVQAIAEAFLRRNTSPKQIPAVLVSSLSDFFIPCLMRSSCSCSLKDISEKDSSFSV